jgi:CHASE3 domain sensor protein
LSRYLLIRVLVVSAIVAVVAVVWTTGRIQSSADDSTRALAAGQAMLTAMLDQETGLRGYINTRSQEFLAPYTRGRADLETATALAHRCATERFHGPLRRRGVRGPAA